MFLVSGVFEGLCMCVGECVCVCVCVCVCECVWVKNIPVDLLDHD